MISAGVGGSLQLALNAGVAPGSGSPPISNSSPSESTTEAAKGSQTRPTRLIRNAPTVRSSSRSSPIASTKPLSTKNRITAAGPATSSRNGVANSQP